MIMINLNKPMCKPQGDAGIRGVFETLNQSQSFNVNLLTVCDHQNIYREMEGLVRGSGQ
jgi:hypothetical protein